MSPLSDPTLPALVGAGYFGPFHWDGREILRRIFVTVRDRNWQEVSPTRWEWTVDDAEGAVNVAARHTSDTVDFEWQGRLEVRLESRTMRFAFQGQALKTMAVCRLGLVVLHPVEAMVGARVTSVGPQGERILVVEGQIAPQPVVNAVPVAMTEPFSTLIVERPDVGRLELKMAGDLFELEDQRNWGDASFKTYCTPLRLGFPRKVEAGTAIAQSVAAQFTPASTRLAPRAPANRKGASMGVFPAIGREWDGIAPSDGAMGTEPEWYHFYIDTLRDGARTRLESLLETSPVKLEVAIAADDTKELDVTLIALLRRHHRRVRRLLLFGAGGSPPTASAVERWRRQFERSSDPRLPTLAAVRGFFVEFNRSVRYDARVIGAAFPLTATVHSDDASTIIDNVATIRDMAQSARALTGLRHVAIAPLALYYPPSAKPPGFPPGLAAPWLASTLIYAAAARVGSVTLAGDVLRAVPAALLRRLVDCAGYDVALLGVESSPSLRVAALKRRGQRPNYLLAANLAEEPVTFIAESGIEITVPRRDVSWIETVAS